MISQIKNEGEKIFASAFFNHNNWIYQPGPYRFSNGSKYTPDFKDLKRDVLIEVSATRQAFHASKNKYARFLKEFPLKKFEIRNQYGKILDKYYNICLTLSEKIRINKTQIKTGRIFQRGIAIKGYNAKLKQAIKQKGLTQNDVSEKIGKNPAFLSMVINGKWIPTDAEKALIANALQVQISEIFE